METFEVTTALAKPAASGLERIPVDDEGAPAVIQVATLLAYFQDQLQPIQDAATAARDGAQLAQGAAETAEADTQAALGSLLDGSAAWTADLDLGGHGLANAARVDVPGRVGTSDTGALIAPRGTTAQRPAVPAGLTAARWNSDLGRFEVWDGAAWVASLPLAGGTMTGKLISGYSSSLRLPAGTTAQRDGAPAVGDVRWNSDLGRYEGWDGAAWSRLGGRLVQRSVTLVNTKYGITAQIPADNTTPQIGEGTEIASAVITPKGAANRLLIRTAVPGATVSGTGQEAIYALFLGGPGAVASQYVYTAPPSCNLVYDQVAGGTAAITVSLRAGVTAASTTLRINADLSGNSILNGTQAIALVIEEYEP